MRKTKKTSRRYTDQQVLDMLKNAVMWRDALRAAAVERGYGGASVTPDAEVFDWLRGKVR